MSGNIGNIRQQVGETLGAVRGLEASVRALDERVKERQADAKEETKGLRSEIGNVKHEQRAELQIISLRLEKQEDKTEKLTAQLNNITEKVNDVSKGVDDLQGPVTELVNMKRRFVAFAAFGMSIMAVLWSLTEQLRAWAVHKIFNINW